MQTYQVKIEEKLSTLIIVEAETQEEAIEKVKDMYNDCEVVLSADDFMEVSFKIKESTVGHDDLI